MKYSDTIVDRLNRTGRFHPTYLALLEEQRKQAFETQHKIPDIKPNKIRFAVTYALMIMRQQRYLTDQQRVLADIRADKERQKTVTVHKSRAVGKSELALTPEQMAKLPLLNETDRKEADNASTNT